MYTYRQIFKQALKIAWHNPALWFFGFFVSLLGTVGDLEVIFGGYSFSQQSTLLAFWQGLGQGGIFSLAGFKGIAQVLSSNPFQLLLVTFFGLLVLGISVLVIWLTIVSQAALISQVVRLGGKQGVNWQQGWQVGLAKFWPILGLNAVLRLVIWLLLLLSGLVTLLNFPGSLFIFILVFDGFLFLMLIFSFIAKYAICGVVLKDWKFKQSILLAWQTFTRNWLISLEVAVILFFIFFVVNSILVYFISLILIYSLGLFIDFLFGLLLVFILLLGVFLFVQILLTIFFWATWTFIFELITSQKRVLFSQLKKGFQKLIS